MEASRRIVPPGPVSRIGTVLLVWMAAEALALAAVVHLTGWSGAILIGLATSLIGFLTLRRLGTQTLDGLRATMAGRPTSEGAVLDGTLAGFGALLLILPGFVSDAIGLALTSPSVRVWARQRMTGLGGRQGGGPKTLDLDPTDWRPLPDRERR